MRLQPELLDERDKAAMRRESNFALAFAFVCWIGAISAVLSLELSTLGDVLIGFVFLGGIGLFGFGRQLRADVNDGTLKTVEGPIALNVVNAGKLGPRYSVRIDRQRFSLTRSMFLSLSNHHEYRLYYSPRTRRVIRWEPRLPPSAMRDADQTWMAYITEEVRAACDAKGWGYQIRRKWSVREKPVSESPVDDYEWKLIPGRSGRLPDPPLGHHGIDEGTYYVLGFEWGGRFVLQHDTNPRADLRWGVSTYTELQLFDVTTPPPTGWLRKQLVDLTSRFKPNLFSLT